ncbi:hypothetical protein [Streptomyces sp. Inha503]|uniref:hypothetical protein n=1 Tax=Streptomyces sp. Inha503 TaxID=3383314 RepID=UPI00399F4B72
MCELLGLVEAALLDERDRSAFLEETTRRLGASLHHGRTVRALVEMVIPKLANASVVVLPVSGRRTHWHRAGPGDARPAGEVAVEVAALDDVLPGELVRGEEALVAQLAAGGVRP